MGASATSQSDLPSGLVTFLFTDIEGSTRLAHTLNQSYRTVLQNHRLLLRNVFKRRTGAELLTEGDSFFVAFADPMQAVRAALEAQYALMSHHWPTHPSWREPARPKVRMGIHTGHATPDEHGYASSAVHRAARVCAAAHGDQILCSQSAFDACGGLNTIDLGLHVLRGFDDSERLHQILDHGLPRNFPPPLAKPRHHNLPANSDEFVGRHNEITDLTRLIATHRLISVTALPGTGKTRLVRQVAHRIAPNYADGAWYTSLRPTNTDTAAAIAGSLGLRGDPFRPWLDTLTEHLNGKNCLLIVDNTRKTDAETLTHILDKCPDVTILSTSPRPLGLTGEVKWALPNMKNDDAAILLRNQATAAAGGIDPGDCSAVATAVDGFPPAINILAKIIPVYGVAELERRLRQNPLALLDARHELSAVLNTCYDTLTPDAARLLRAMSALPKPAGVIDVEELCGGSGAALAALIDLVDTSLVDVQRQGGAARYRLPAPVRWYADALRRWAKEPAPRLEHREPKPRRALSI